jgi:hypothetical protein
MPIRYSALESLSSNIYTIESEVWTFGVVLWEVFTFAQEIPYDKELPNCSIALLVNFLKDHRLHKPEMMPFSM